MILNNNFVLLLSHIIHIHSTPNNKSHDSKKQSSNHHGYHYTYRDYFNRILCISNRNFHVRHYRLMLWLQI